MSHERGVRPNSLTAFVQALMSADADTAAVLRSAPAGVDYGVTVDVAQVPMPIVWYYGCHDGIDG